MGVNISGSGILSGIASLVMGAVNNLNLLVTRIIGYTTVPGTGGSSYYTTMVGSSGTGYIAKATFGGLAYSSDGVEWTHITDIPFIIRDYVYANNMWFVVGEGGFAKSVDGINWTINTSPLTATKIHTGFLDKFIIEGFFPIEDYGNLGTIALSSDGETFSQLVLGLFGVNSLAYINTPTPTIVYRKNTDYDLHYITFDGSGVELSAGSVSIPVNNTYSLYSMGNKFFALGSQDSNLVKTSTDGINWSNLAIDDGDTQYSFALEVQNTSPNADAKYLLISSSSIAYSNDLLNWNTLALSGINLSQGISASITGYSGDVVYLLDGDNSNLYVFDTESVQIAEVYPSIPWSSLSYANDKLFTEDQSVDPLNDMKVVDVITNEITTVILPGLTFPNKVKSGLINSYTEVQVSIGNQGQEGAEILAPVDVYTVPANKTASIIEVRIKNTSSNPITYDLGILGEDVPLTDQNAIIDDAPINAGATQTIEVYANLTAGNRVVVFPSAVDVVEVKVYGTESNA